jgi:hypothetical protein
MDVGDVIAPNPNAAVTACLQEAAWALELPRATRANESYLGTS